MRSSSLWMKQFFQTLSIWQRVMCSAEMMKKLEFSCLFIKLLSVYTYGSLADHFYGFTDVRRAPVTAFSSIFIDEGICQLLHK